MEDVCQTILEDFDGLGSFRFVRQCGSRLVDDAYALQRGFRALREARGERVVGYKIGCTGAVIQAKLGITEAVHGYLWAGEQEAHEAVLSAARFRRLGIEGELGVRLIGSTKGSPSDWEVEYEPVCELHHFAFDGPPEERAFELITRNAIHAGVVHANDRKRCLLKEIPLHAPIMVKIDGVEVERPTLHDLELDGLRGPLATVTWLQSRLEREGNGERLRPGDFILTATPGNLIPLEAGNRLDVDFMGLRSTCSITTVKAGDA